MCYSILASSLSVNTGGYVPSLHSAFRANHWCIKPFLLPRVRTRKQVMGFFSWSDEDLMVDRVFFHEVTYFMHRKATNHDSDPISPTHESHSSELTPQRSSRTIVWGICPVASLWNILRSVIEKNPLDPHRDTWLGGLYSGYKLQRFGAPRMFRSSQPQCGCRYHTCGSDGYLGNAAAVEIWGPKCTLDWISTRRWVISMESFMTPQIYIDRLERENRCWTGVNATPLKRRGRTRFPPAHLFASHCSISRSGNPPF